jgi:catechol 2,3-dioxygenase-like lactoylglutathione lyase family enzyme
MVSTKRGRCAAIHPVRRYAVGQRHNDILPRIGRVLAMHIHHISAITLAVRDMGRAVTFYRTLGFDLLYGGESAGFTSFRAGDAFLNLILAPSYEPGWWGRVILRVEAVDNLYEAFITSGLHPEPPRDGSWGERFFHLADPDGHELSFAQLIR